MMPIYRISERNMSKQIDYNALNQILDTTWGRSSTPKAASYSMKFSFSGGSRLTATYIDTINFSTAGEMKVTKILAEEAADKLMQQKISLLKKQYKELTDESLALKEYHTSDSLEMTSGGHHHTSKRTAYYRKTYIFDMT